MCVAKYAKIGLSIRKGELKFYGTNPRRQLSSANDSELLVGTTILAWTYTHKRGRWAALQPARSQTYAEID